jgi:hypothetical protein
VFNLPIEFQDFLKSFQIVPNIPWGRKSAFFGCSKSGNPKTGNRDFFERARGGQNKNKQATLLTNAWMPINADSAEIGSECICGAVRSCCCSVSSCCFFSPTFRTIASMMKKLEVRGL